MGTSVTLSFDTWMSTFPEFSGLTETQWNLYYVMAQEFIRNDGGGPVRSVSMQTQLLNLATAHCVQLFVGTQSNPASANDPVGRVTNAGQGSVSAGFDLSIEAGTAQWFAQTKYGIALWTMGAVNRTFRYIPGRGRPINPIPYW